MRVCWDKLVALGREEVRQTIRALPAPLRERAEPLPVCFERQPNADILADGYDPDLLGLFIGPPFGEPESSPLPPQIILYLENLWDFAECDEEFFREEVRITYLHELGHYLGLDEINLEERAASRKAATIACTRFCRVVCAWPMKATVSSTNANG